MTLNLTKQIEGCWREEVGRRGMGLWTLGRVCALVSAVKCVNLVIPRPVPLGIKIYVYKKLKIKKKESFMVVSNTPL